jgi:hypothetical protein
VLIDSQTGQHISDVAMYSNNSIVAYSGKNGEIDFILSKDSVIFMFSHPLYMPLRIPSHKLVENSVIKLHRRSTNIDEIEIVAKRPHKIGRTLLLPFTFKYMPSWNDKLFTFYPKRNNKYIKSIKYRIVDYKGTKGLKNLAFKANLFTVNPVSKLPDKPLLDKDTIINNSDGNKWVSLDVSKNKIKIPENGIFIALIIPEKEFYKVKYIRSRSGVHCAVPAIKTRIKKTSSEIYSLRFPKSPHNKTNRLPDQYFMMKLEYCDE